jgi:hypothetical protein
MKQHGTSKRDGFAKYLGCNRSFFYAHIESQFKRGMTWDNYGKVWHIDHIIPVSTFDHRDKEQAFKCWHFSNLRPMFAVENMKKGAKIVTCQPELLLAM